MENYNSRRIEKKWQGIWQELEIFKAKDFSKKPKFYILVEFPYTSGDGLHVGHCRSYTALDIVARKRRMEGFNVLFPMGWDAFGLPTENYAIKTGIEPGIITKKNTANFKNQTNNLGLSFDWSREINTTDSDYYKWTQWIFLQLFKKGLAYKTKIPINWCPSCKIGLANEEVVNGGCERCGEKVERKEKEQWMLKITKYAERLIQDLVHVDYSEKIKLLQKDWIGRSDGWEINFSILNSQFSIPIFTTRTDTLFGCTYLVLAPEHSIVQNLKSQILNFKSVEKYIEDSKKKTERERISDVKEKNGIELKGIKAINPVNGREIPIWVADYVLVSYGTGAIMSVPAHDQRDFDFTRKYNLPVIEVIRPKLKKKDFKEKVSLTTPDGRFKKAYEGKGILINSGRFSGIKSESAKDRIGEWLEKKTLTKRVVYYKLRDWIFSRQRYWGEPIPMIKCKKCGWVPVLENNLPVELPKVRKYQPTKNGESPLASVKKWINTKCPKCGGLGKRETDVMPNWAGSNWYFLRYCDPKNDKKLASSKLLKYWMPVDWYNGGMEHATLHLLYSRFIYKFLWDINAVPRILGSEPYKKRTSHGMVLGEGGIKMSKSKGNVINPNKVIKEYGADTMRIYEMFMGPFEQAIVWDTKGVKGARRFLDKVWRLSSQFLEFQKNKSSLNLKKLLHKTIKKVSEDIENLKFNTAVSSLMEFSNAWQTDKEGIGKQEFKDFLKIFSPFAPHLTEELWFGIKDISFQRKEFKIKDSVHFQSWPKYNPKLFKEKNIILVIQINGKIRDKIEVECSISEKKARKIALSQEKIKRWLVGKKIKKVIFIPEKLINIVF